MAVLHTNNMQISRNFYVFNNKEFISWYTALLWTVSRRWSHKNTPHSCLNVSLDLLNLSKNNSSQRKMKVYFWIYFTHLVFVLKLLRFGVTGSLVNLIFISLDFLLETKLIGVPSVFVILIFLFPFSPCRRFVSQNSPYVS